MYRGYKANVFASIPNLVHCVNSTRSIHSFIHSSTHSIIIINSFLSPLQSHVNTIPIPYSIIHQTHMIIITSHMYFLPSKRIATSHSLFLICHTQRNILRRETKRTFRHFRTPGAHFDSEQFIFCLIFLGSLL